MATVKCPRCGYPNRQEAHYCVNCRWRLNEDAPADSAPRPGWSEKRHAEAVAPVVFNGHWRLIDRTGATVRDLSFKNDYSTKCEIDPFREGYARVRTRTGFGYIDKNGSTEIPTIYDAGLHFSEGLVPVKRGLYWGYLDPEGKATTPFSFTSASEFHGGLAAVQVGKKWGYIDHSYKYVIPPIFDYATPFSEGLAAVEYGWGWGYINKEGHAVIPDALKDGNTLSRFLKNRAYSIVGKAQLLDQDGDVVAALPFHHAESYSDGCAAVSVEVEDDSSWKKRYSFRYVDRQGNFLMLGSNLDILGQAGPFSEGCAAMSPGRYASSHVVLPSKSGGLGYYSLDGRCICTPYLDRAFPFKEGLASVSYLENGQRHCGFLTRQGNMLMDFNSSEFTIFENFSQGLAPVGRMERNSWKYGYVAPSGQEVIPFQYERAMAFGN